jgi:hypothetical protein
MTVSSLEEGGKFAMIETRSCCRHRGTLVRVVLSTAMLVFLVAWALPAQTSEPVSSETQVSAGSGEVTSPQSGLRSMDDLSIDLHQCLSPSTQQWVIIAVGTLAIFVLCFFLLVRLVQRAFIHRDKNASLGRHCGISLTFLVSSLGMVGLAYLVTGCLNHQFLIWLCFPLALWLIHGIYTLIVVRSE